MNVMLSSRSCCWKVEMRSEPTIKKETAHLWEECGKLWGMSVQLLKFLCFVLTGLGQAVCFWRQQDVVFSGGRATFSDQNVVLGLVLFIFPPTKLSTHK